MKKIKQEETSLDTLEISKNIVETFGISSKKILPKILGFASTTLDIIAVFVSEENRPYLHSASVICRGISTILKDKNIKSELEKEQKVVNVMVDNAFEEYKKTDKYKGESKVEWLTSMLPSEIKGDSLELGENKKYFNALSPKDIVEFTYTPTEKIYKYEFEAVEIDDYDSFDDCE